jgi:hypothetical protein
LGHFQLVLGRSVGHVLGQTHRDDLLVFPLIADHDAYLVVDGIVNEETPHLVLVLVGLGLFFGVFSV